MATGNSTEQRDNSQHFEYLQQLWGDVIYLVSAVTSYDCNARRFDKSLTNCK